jgi:hypothetical protein
VSGDPIRLGDYLKDAEVFEHPLLYIGRINPHYGHFIIESLSYWWALTEHLGNVKYLVHAHDASVFEISYVRDCMHAAGIDSERLIYSKRPLKIREIHVPQSAFQLNSHVFKKYVKKSLKARGHLEKRQLISHYIFQGVLSVRESPATVEKRSLNHSCLTAVCGLSILNDFHSISKSNFLTAIDGFLVF